MKEKNCLWIKCPKAVIPAKAGIQENTLDAGSSPA